ncbi:MAG: 50S ribosomal protein L11 methyltransferase [Myxococcales bacterium]|nr:50S ribosomal protein L11 methyltransferase [Myxococcales bacterium]
MTEPRYPVLVLEAPRDDVDLLIGKLTLLGAEGIEERDASTLVKNTSGLVTLIASFDDDASAAAALEALGDAHKVTLDAVVGDSWRDGWKAHWKPTRITPTVVVVPNWLSYDPEPGDRVLRLDPGRAFGTGQHPSTALASRAIERRLTGAAHGLLLDLGCGSGILGFVALMHGCGRVVGNDIDEDSIINARENAEALGFASQFDLRIGGFEAVPETSALVVANIEAKVLVPFAATVGARVEAGGALILSGILVEQRAEVVAAYEALGFSLERAEVEGEWICPEFRKA